jgi:tetratricopeptide (TPR) repeat protein
LTTSSSNCARSSWLRRASALALVVLPAAALAAAPAPQRARSGDIEQAWFRLTQSLEKFTADTLKERTEELLQVAAKAEIQRLTPQALALVAQSRAETPSRAEAILTQASRLDPESPEVWFSMADVRLGRFNFGSGLAALFRGLLALLGDPRLKPLVDASALLSAVVGLAIAFVIWGVLVMRRSVPRLWHDLSETGAQWSLGANGVVLGLLIIALPLFAGGDPAWVVVWLFALCWAYLPPLQKAIGAIGLLLIAAMPTLVELGFRNITHPPNAILEATAILADHRYSPQIFEDLESVQDVFVTDPEYHLLVGDLNRQFGQLDAAGMAYREGLRIAPRHAALSEALGTVHYLEGDYNAALQGLQTANETGYDPVVANYNLYLAYAQTYHFKESEEAMAAARQANEHRLTALTRGRQHDIVLVPVTKTQALSILKRVDSLVLLNRGLTPPPLVRERTFMQPLSIGGALALLVALAHFLIRQRTGGFASACLKCGRTFCRKCKLSHESQSYCTQCINIFLKKDMVGIDAQVAKRHQLARRQFWLHVERRTSDLVLPGLGVALGGKPVLGGILAIVALVCSTLALLWLPHFVSPALMATSLWPLQALFGSLWLAAAVLAQLLPAEWR